MWITLEDRDWVRVVDILLNAGATRIGRGIQEAVADQGRKLATRYRSASLRNQDDDVCVDGDATVSIGDDDGAYVMAWIWVNAYDLDELKYECQGCSATWDLEDLNEIEDIHQRVSPGDLMPYGQCPICGVVVHKKESI